MLNEDQIAIDFYRGSGVQDVLKRYEFSDKENKVILAAILTSRRKTPNMKFIRTADALLKHIAMSRTPIEQNSNTSISPQILAQFEAMTKETKRKSRSKQKESLEVKYMRFADTKILLFAILSAFFIYLSLQYFAKKSLIHIPVTFQEAQKICLEQDKKLPLTYADFDDTSKYRYDNIIGYWSRNGTIYLNKMMPFIENDTQKHYVKCLEKE